MIFFFFLEGEVGRLTRRRGFSCNYLLYRSGSFFHLCFVAVFFSTIYHFYCKS